MNDKTAHAKLKKICEDTTRYRNAKRERVNSHEKVNEALNTLSKLKEKISSK